MRDDWEPKMIEREPRFAGIVAGPKGRGITYKLREKQVETMAIACCYAEFTADESAKVDPKRYWKGCSDETKAFFREQAASLLALIATYPAAKSEPQP